MHDLVDSRWLRRTDQTCLYIRSQRNDWKDSWTLGRNGNVKQALRSGELEPDKKREESALMCEDGTSEPSGRCRWSEEETEERTRSEKVMRQDRVGLGS